MSRGYHKTSVDSPRGVLERRFDERGGIERISFERCLSPAFQKMSSFDEEYLYNSVIFTIRTCLPASCVRHVLTGWEPHEVRP